MIIEKLFNLLAADMAGAKPTKAGIRVTLSYKLLILIGVGYISAMQYEQKQYREESRVNFIQVNESLHQDSLRMNILNADIVTLKGDMTAVNKSNIELRSAVGLPIFTFNN